MITIRPPPRSSMSGMTLRQHRCTPRTFTSKTRHHSSGVISQAIPRLPPPAFATSRSTAPISSKPRSTDSCELTSISTARPPISDATASISARVRAATATSQPSRASARAILAPIPRPPPVTSALGNRPSDLLERLRVLERGEVARVLAEHPRTDGAADDLRGARLRQRGHPEDAVRLERLAEHVCDRGRDALVVRDTVGLCDAEDPRHLALHLVRNADRRRLGDDPAANRSRLELRRADSLAGDVQRVVAAPVQEPVAVGVDRRPVAVRPDAGKAPPVRILEALAVRIVPEAARHSRPRTPADQLADLAAYGLSRRVDDVHVHAECGEAERNRLDRLDEARREEARADLRAAADVHDRDARLPDPVEEPLVRIRVPRLTGRAEHL